MKFWKMNGAGNEIVVFDARSEKLDLSPERIRAIADPRTGAGADQIMCMERSLSADMYVRIYNSDGGEVGACGNGMRCVAFLAMQETGRDSAVFETSAGKLSARREGGRIWVDMGSPLLKWEEIPLSERMDTRGIDLKIGPIDDPYLKLPGAVNMGNPHIVFFVPQLDQIDVRAVGSLLEHHPLFPEGVNVGFAQVNGRDRIRLRVWERGAGLTKACGTGACAAVVAGHRRKLLDRKASVAMDGGLLAVEWLESDDHVILTGPVELEYESAV
jgi:diaminopimelate epimerase